VERRKVNDHEAGEALLPVHLAFHYFILLFFQIHKSDSRSVYLSEFQKLKSLLRTYLANVKLKIKSS